MLFRSVSQSRYLGALLLSLSREWLSRQWTRFTVWFELTLDGLFDFDALLPGEMVMALTENSTGNAPVSFMRSSTMLCEAVEMSTTMTQRQVVVQIV